MPRGIRKVDAAPVAPVVPAEPAPMIFIEPAGDGSIGLNAYGLYAGEVVDALRRALIQLHAQRAGVQVISVEVPAQAAVVARLPASRNGVTKASAKAQKTPRVRHFDERDDDYFEDDAEEAISTR